MTSTVKLSQLRLSVLNVRRVAPSAASIDQLAADLAAKGLVQSLAVYKEGRTYQVFAGGRRFRALTQLMKAGTITGDYEVPVIVRTKAEAAELSLTENTQRESMHPADQFRAFAVLRDELGMNAEQIAARFGYAKTHVVKLLSLGSLAPSLLDAMGEDRLSINTARTLTMAEGHEVQEQLFAQYGDDDWRIRKALTVEKISTKGARFRFVGVEAYTAAGGTITSDLFAKDDEGFADHPEIITQLVSARLTKVEAELKAEGWAVVSVEHGRPDNYYNVPSLSAVTRDATEEEATELAEIAAKIDELEADEANDHSDEITRLATRGEQIEEALESYPPELRAENGVMAFIDHGGELSTRPFQIIKTTPRSDGKASNAGSGYSAQLTADLTTLRTIALQNAIADDHGLAIDILLDTLAGQLFHRAMTGSQAAGLTIQGTKTAVDDTIEGSLPLPRVEAALFDRFSDIPADQRFAVIRGMDAGDKMTMLAAIVAHSVNAIDYSNGYDQTRIANADQYAEAAGLDVAQVWTPNIETLARIKKPTLFQIMKDDCGVTDAAEQFAKMKRDELARTVAERLPAGWLPAPMKSLPKQPTDEGEISEAA